jgi:hypothetical protein
MIARQYYELYAATRHDDDVPCWPANQVQSKKTKHEKRFFFFWQKKVGIGARRVFAAQSDPSKSIRSIAMGIAARGRWFRNCNSEPSDFVDHFI